MEIKERNLKGIYEITLIPRKDERGFFMRTYDERIFNEFGINCNWVQENHSASLKKGTLRGLHFQYFPFQETKLVRCIRGKIFDVFVDLRKDSPNFGKWDSIILSEHNYKAIYIPRGFAHGFCSLSDNSEILYKVDNWYSPDNESGIIWDDSDINIEWPLKDLIISQKDQKLKGFSEIIQYLE